LPKTQFSAQTFRSIPVQTFVYFPFNSISNKIPSVHKHQNRNPVISEALFIPQFIVLLSATVWIAADTRYNCGFVVKKTNGHWIWPFTVVRW